MSKPDRNNCIPIFKTKKIEKAVDSISKKTGLLPKENTEIDNGEVKRKRREKHSNFYFYGMPNLSQRGQDMPASPIRKLVPFADEAKRRGIKVYHLNIGQPDIETPKTALDAIRGFDRKVIEYSPSNGYASYRQKLSAYYARFGLDVDPEEILITTGGSEAILFGLFSCLDPGDEVIIPEPFYANYNGFAKAGNIRVRPVTAHIEDGFALPSISDFEAQINDRSKAIIICNPNNPTGYIYSDEELESLRKLILKYDLFLFSDEVYREFSYDGRVHKSVLELEGCKEHVVMVDSISKRYSACGARVGALVTKNRALYATAMKFAQARLSPPTLGQVLAEAAVDTDKQYFQEVNTEYVQRRNVVVEALRQMDGVICPMPRGAFYAMAQLPVDDSERFCRWLLESFSYEGETIMLAPASGFYSNSELGKKQVRIAYVLCEEDLHKALKCLKLALEEYPGRC